MKFAGFAAATIRQKLLFTAGLALLIFTGLLAGGFVYKVNAADCDNNAIIFCGASTPSAFVNQARANDSKNGHHDLQAIYAYYGLEPSSYDRFVSYARQGTAYKDGRIVVDGQVVATNATSIGREASAQGSGYFTQNIAGQTYYGNTNAQAFASDSIPVMVLFNSQGVMQFAVLSSCGNPTTGQKVTPSYSCDLLNKTPVSGQFNTYSFTTSASAANNAVIKKFVYDFGDGTTATTTSAAVAVQHTYSKPGSYTARVTVYVSLPGNQQVTITSAKCSTLVVVAPPVTPHFSCVQLTGAILNQSQFSYSFEATADVSNGATFTSADFDFGDGQAADGVQPAGMVAHTSHTYAAAGNYTITSTLHFNVNGTATSVTCSATITPTQPPTPECRPGVPQGSPMCTPCPTNSSIPASDTQNCVVPASTLVNTGPGGMIALFGGTVVAGYFIFRHFLYRKYFTRY